MIVSVKSMHNARKCQTRSHAPNPGFRKAERLRFHVSSIETNFLLKSQVFHSLTDRVLKSWKLQQHKNRQILSEYPDNSAMTVAKTRRWDMPWREWDFQFFFWDEWYSEKAKNIYIYFFLLNNESSHLPVIKIHCRELWALKKNA